MATVSITQAAKLAGVARSHFYKTYLDTGVISLSKNQKGKPCIDTSELLRVFGTLQGLPPKTGQRTTLEDSTGQSRGQSEDKLIQQEKEIRQLEQQLREAQTREAWYQAQIQNLTDTMKQLEGPKPQRPWWRIWR